MLYVFLMKACVPAQKGYVSTLKANAFEKESHAFNTKADVLVLKAVDFIIKADVLETKTHVLRSKNAVFCSKPAFIGRALTQKVNLTYPESQFPISRIRIHPDYYIFLRDIAY